jgi:thiamine-phosphate pyrophosphorylase
MDTPDIAADTPEMPQIYLISPATFEREAFAATLARVLDGIEVACVRLTMPGSDADSIARTADALREVTHTRDVALVVTDHLMLVEPHGLDGVHLSDAARSVRAARKALGADAIVGSHCATSRHDGLNAGEAGADYVSFGPLTATGLGDGAVVPLDLLQWWSEVIELPVVTEGGLTPDAVRRVAPYTDFFAIGDEIWGRDDPLAALKDLHGLMG